MKDSANISYRNLSKVELLGLAEICQRIHLVEPEQSFVLHIRGIMSEIFSNIQFCAEFHQLDPFGALERISHAGERSEIPIFSAGLHEHPEISLPANPVAQIGSSELEPCVNKFRDSIVYNEFSIKVLSENQIWIALFEGSEFLNCVYARETPFTNNELAMVEMILPHIELAWKYWRQIRSLQQELDGFKQPLFEAEQQAIDNHKLRLAIDALPHRQREVIEKVANGFDNQQIADAMGISIRTVHKHLENIYRALDIHHRTDLAAKWHQSRAVRFD